eukprot:CAMPEP_0181191246 /NCGR_PEP_ID=MMETSP1096-20121128/12635_1 /TAXON_ID=156174 ORGANISM="Chrysochromulina ericina, Strain CCMP281" /NCGR_SAMPLE_ID=MMETSP1096 /ASSEMBLY_ACC=CAM_ASM_000453 /LENGTH=524 /DNA_ID=CAMNT_0023280537 /DNA_START=195 /DNA_END=1769 /DNA_ORIENTATION=-
MLQAYLHLLLPRGSSLPTLVTFVRAPPYAALGVAPMEAAAALPSATAAQALALLRGNQDRRQLILQAGMERVVSIARDHAKHKPLIDAGAVEWLCYVLREMAPGTPLFEIAPDACAALACLARIGSPAHDAVCEVLWRCGALEVVTAVMDGFMADAGLQASCSALIVSLCAASHEFEGTTSHFEMRAVSAVCRSMGWHDVDVHVQRHGCAALQALAHRSAVLADLAVCHDGVLLVCKAMRTFRTDKSAGRLCPTFFSSAFVSTPHKYHGFVYRPPPGHFSIGLQASACAVLVKLAEIKRAALQMRQMSAASLLEQTLEDFLGDTEESVLITLHVFSVAITLFATQSDMPVDRFAPQSNPLTDPMNSEGSRPRLANMTPQELVLLPHCVFTPRFCSVVWRALRTHHLNASLQVVGCELLSEVLREDYRRSTAGRCVAADTSLLTVHDGETVRAAMQRVLGYISLVLEGHGRDASVQRAVLRLFSALSATARALVREEGDDHVPILSAEERSHVMVRLQQLSTSVL